MAKLINALFSISAAGRLGGLVYETGPSGQYVKVHTPQRKKPSEKQRIQNFLFGVASDKWRLLTDEEKKALNIRAQPLKITGYNLFIKENIGKIAQYGTAKYGIDTYT